MPPAHRSGWRHRHERVWAEAGAARRAYGCRVSREAGKLSTGAGNLLIHTDIGRVGVARVDELCVLVRCAVELTRGPVNLPLDRHAPLNLTPLGHTEDGRKKKEQSRPAHAGHGAWFQKHF